MIIANGCHLIGLVEARHHLVVLVARSRHARLGLNAVHVAVAFAIFTRVFHKYGSTFRSFAVDNPTSLLLVKLFSPHPESDW